VADQFVLGFADPISSYFDHRLHRALLSGRRASAEELNATHKRHGRQ